MHKRGAKQELTETRHPGRIPAPTIAASESQSLPKPAPPLPLLGATSATTPAKQPSPPCGTSAGNRAAAAAAMDGRSTPPLPSPPPLRPQLRTLESLAEWEEGVRGDGCGDAAGCCCGLLLPLEGGMAAAEAGPLGSGRV